VELPEGYEIELLPDGARAGTDAADGVMDFWARHDAVRPADVPDRLGFVVCVLRGPDGAVAATSAAREADVEALGGRRLWMFRCFAPGAEARACVEAMVKAARDLLSERPGAGGRQPIGLCFPISDPELMAERDDAFWPDAKLIYAGWTTAGEQLRVTYFDGAPVA
jgi:hypothetical protein